MLGEDSPPHDPEKQTGWEEGERERQLGEKEGLAISPNQSGTAHGDRRERGSYGPWGRGLRGGAWWGWGPQSIGCLLKHMEKEDGVP